MRLYTKALHTLQEAISSESGCMDAEILCATRESGAVSCLESFTNQYFYNIRTTQSTRSESILNK